MLAGAHKKFYRIQHPEIYLLDLKVQYKHKIKLSLDMVSRHVFLCLCLSDYKQHERTHRKLSEIWPTKEQDIRQDILTTLSVKCVCIDADSLMN